MAPRVKPAPNLSVHSASRFDQSNARTVIAEMRFMRYHNIVYFDHAEDRFVFVQFEHDKRVDEMISREGEKALLAKLSESMEKIAREYMHHYRFAKARAVNQDHLGECVPGIRTFDPSKRKTRSLLDRYTPFNPNAYPDE